MKDKTANIKIEPKTIYCQDHSYVKETNRLWVILEFQGNM